MEKLRQQLVAVTKDLRESEGNLSSTDTRLKSLREKKSAYIQKLYQEQEVMGGVVSAARRYGQDPALTLFFEATPIEAARASLVMKSAIPALHEQSTALKAELQEIARIEDDIVAQLDLQTEQANKLNKQQEKLQALLDDRQDVYRATEAQRAAQEKEVAELARKSKNIEDLLDKVKEKNKLSLRAPRLSLPSDMALPVNGRIETSFGENDELGAPSKGLTLVTRPGARVTVPLAGVVKFAGPFQNFKQILIVEHRGGYHSLIAGLAHIDTVVGATLAAGEPVGTAENSDSPKIYYELRQNGKAINPQKLLVAQRKQEKS